MATLTISFTAPIPAPTSGYKVKYRKVGTTDYTTMSPNPTSSPITIASLDPGQYEGSIQAQCSSTYAGMEIAFLSNTLDCSVGIDMVFILDVTGSMGATISNLKTAITTYTDKVIEKSNNNYRFGLITVNESSGGPAIIQKPVLFATNNKTSLISGLAPLTATGGGGAPEPTDVALGYVLEDSDNYVGTFRSGVVKIIVIMTDALPSGGDDAYNSGDLTRAQVLANLAFTKGARIFAINVGGGISDSGVRQVMKLYADTSLGVYSESSTGVVSSNIIDALDALCNN